MRNARLDELQTGIKIGRRNINNLRSVDDTTLRAESIDSRGERSPWLPLETRPDSKLSLECNPEISVEP